MTGPVVNLSGPRFELALTPGPRYRHTMGFLFIRLQSSPQIACWIETPEGKYMDTIYVTEKVARKSWFGAPAAGRPEALPVWTHAKAAGPLSDAVSGATPGGSVQVQSALPARLSPGRYIVKLEINASFDYNERYTRANSGVNGQPSLVYSGGIDVGKGESSVDLTPLGTGSLDGSDGNIRPGVEGLTTALQMLQSARIVYHDR